MQQKKAALTFLWSPNTDSHSDYRYRNHHSYSPSCCFGLVSCHDCKRILLLASSPSNKVPSQDLDHGWESILCSGTSDLKNPVVNSQHPILDYFLLLLFFLNPDRLSERICAYTWCTPRGSFLSNSLEIPTEVSQWGDWQQSTMPAKRLFFVLPSAMLAVLSVSSEGTREAAGTLCCNFSFPPRAVTFSSPLQGRNTSH